MGLDRFIKAQEKDYLIALSEIRRGKKRGHWIWYIFPQLAGLGYSEMSKYYAIKDIQEAKDYLAHPLLGKRLVEISQALLGNDKSVQEVMGSPDDMKLRSSMTLFSIVSQSEDVFTEVLKKFYNGVKDPATIEML